MSLHHHSFRTSSAASRVGVAVAAVLLSGMMSACSPKPPRGPRERFAPESIVITLDGKATATLVSDAPADHTADATFGAVRVVDGPVSTTPLLRFTAAPGSSLGAFSHAIVSIKDLGPAPNAHAPGGGAPATFDRPSADVIWYTETGRIGASILPGQPLNLSTPTAPTIRLESDGRGQLERVLFYPGTLYEVVVTYVGAKGLASQLIRFTVAS